ncbi:MAG: MJ0042-type zinc finger domain-containing protein [Novosphingobium sp.]|uniref:MJ0042-type zinc finger domain-containing protein n=1 Tax=Novosphingobium sp. TaxID=1874826 RepID=UPI0032BAA93E
MIISCPACATRYVVPDSAIGIEGRTVRCAKCRHAWFQDGPEVAAKATAAPGAEPVAPPPPLNFAIDEAPQPAPSISDYADEPQDDDGSYSRFAHEPLFRPRRNPAKIAMYAAVLFAVVALGSIAAAAWYGLPEWLPFAQQSFAEEQAGLKLDFPAKQQGQRELPDGSFFFEANGSITNTSDKSRSVPTVLVVLYDARGTQKFTQEIHSPKRTLAPGESVSINEALVNVPKAAVKAKFGWKPGN